MKKLFISVLSLFFIIGLITSVSAQHEKFIFTMFKGRVSLSRTGGSTWLSLSEQPVEVKPGDMLRAEGGGRGELRYPDGTIVRIKDGAYFTIERSSIHLRIGNVWLKVRRRADVFKVITPLGSCNVLGTSFDVNVDRFGRTNVRVFSGIVAVRAHNDQRNRQLVLQRGMKTGIFDKTRVSEKPEKFQANTIEASLLSEWEARQLVSDKPSREKGLPPMLPEITDAESPVESLFKEVPVKKEAPKERIPIIVRQRSGFLEMLREQRLKKDSVMGERFDKKEKMQREGHGQEFGQFYRPSAIVTDDPSLRMEYFQVRNRLLRVQSQLRQAEMERAALVNRANISSSERRQIQTLQVKIAEYKLEHRQLRLELRDLQTRKR